MVVPFLGGCATLKGTTGHRKNELHFSAHLQWLEGYSAFTDFIKNQSIGVS